MMGILIFTKRGRVNKEIYKVQNEHIIPLLVQQKRHQNLKVTTNWSTGTNQNRSPNSLLVSNNVQHYMKTIAKIHICMPTGSKLLPKKDITINTHTHIYIQKSPNLLFSARVLKLKPSA